MYTGYEWNYDKRFKNSDQIYQAMTNIYDANGNSIRTIELTANVLSATMKADFPELQHISRTTDIYKRLLATDNNSFKIESRYADPDFLKVFHTQFLSGNPELALMDQHSIILTEGTAKRLFGTTEALNKTLKFENQVDLKVTGVVKDFPGNVTYQFEALVPWMLFQNLNQWPGIANWGNHSFYTLMTLDPKTNVDQLNAKLKGTVKKYFPIGHEETFVFPLIKLHLYGDFVNGKSVGGKIQEVQIFTALAMGILLIACINFMNLSTAHSQKRAKEVGIKKTIGATKRTLIVQFLLESLALTTISILISAAMIELLLPWFNNLLDINISIDFFDPIVWVSLLALLISTSFTAGAYPAFYLSAFNPIQIIKKWETNMVLPSLVLDKY
jgi:putative ABC transport system permease protein